MAVSDYVELFSWQSSGGNLATQNGGIYYDSLTIVFLGA
jgi:hypothetical protein